MVTINNLYVNMYDRFFLLTLIINVPELWPFSNNSAFFFDNIPYNQEYETDIDDWSTCDW